MGDIKIVHFTDAEMVEFRLKLKAAEESGGETFTFHGQEYLTKYGHYVVEYYDTFLKKHLRKHAAMN